MKVKKLTFYADESRESPLVAKLVAYGQVALDALSLRVAAYA
jgi:hypothetical protein